MNNDFLAVILISCALLIIAGLTVYAARILFLLKKQNSRILLNRQLRIARIIDSVQTIAKAVEQQQCNLSEASIRLFHLWESLPVVDKPNYIANYPGLYALYERVSVLPTHQARLQLSRKELASQDLIREASEAELESQILQDVAKLKTFRVHGR